MEDNDNKDNGNEDNDNEGNHNNKKLKQRQWFCSTIPR